MTDLPLNHRIGANSPPTAADRFQGRLDALLMRLTALLAEEPTEAVAGQLRDVVSDCIAIDKDLTAEKARDKEPHLAANIAIEAEYRPLVADAARIKSDARTRIDAFLVAEENRRKREAAEARRIADEAAAAALAAQQAAETAPDPTAAEDADDAAHEATMAQHQAVHAERRAVAGPTVHSAAGLGRGTSLRSYWSVRVIDSAAMVAHFANDRGVIEAATKAANALVKATKGTQAIPGCEPVEDRRSA